ncbi:MAG: ABC transporter permease [Rhodospirillales bacterium]|nr:ABC transporter permease [Rhodospirillales bacterium]
MSMLDRKLVRDLARMRGQVASIALVLACGVAVLVAAISTYQSLLASQEAFYAQARFASVFASARRVPDFVAARMADIPGIGVVETRIGEDVTITLGDGGEPLAAHVLSLPDTGAPQLNRLHLREGAMIAPGAANEVLVSEGFAAANHLRPGERINAILNGRRQALRVAGVALSAEYVFATRPGDPIPDDRRYAVLWMRHAALAAAFDMEGGFNDVVASLAPGASLPAVLAAMDDLLEPYGGLVAYGRADQSSHRFLTDEIGEQRTMAVTIPPVFLAVSIFLLHGLLDRLIRAQREQIAALKALGYGDRAIVWHYVKFALIIVVLGAVLGMLAGLWFGRMMVETYTRFFRFPHLAFQLAPWVPALAIGLGVLAGVAGAVGAVSSVARLAPAEAMRPAAPRAHRRGLLDRLRWIGGLATRQRMVLRSLVDRPLRTALTIAGIALAVPIILVTLFWQDALDFMIDVQFAAVERADLVVGFTTAVPCRAEREIAKLPGVLMTEAYRVVPVRLRAGHRDDRTSITGMPAHPVLRRLVGADLSVTAPRADGLVLSARLARRLHLRPGQTVGVEILEGRRRTVVLPVAGVLDDLLGIGAYLRIEALNRLMAEGNSINAVGLVAADPDDPALRRALLDRPLVATISDRTVSLRQFRETTQTFVLVMAGILSAFAVVMAVGVIYNHARVALQERSWQLASLRVLGFTRAEVARLLLGELLVQLVIAVPIGLWLGYWLVRGLAGLYETEMFRIPAVIAPRSYVLAAAVVVLSGGASALLVRRRINRLDLVGVLKARE